jgi:hypothetical protein
MVMDDGRIIRLFKLVVNCLEKIDEGSPDMMRAYLEELKEELQNVIAEIPPVIAKK